MTPQEVAGKAAAIIRERGWVQGRGESPEGCCCLIRAVDLACNERLEVFLQAAEYIRSVQGNSDQSLVGWNDHPDRTVDQVLALLDRAAL